MRSFQIKSENRFHEVEILCKMELFTYMTPMMGVELLNYKINRNEMHQGKVKGSESKQDDNIKQFICNL